MYLSRRPTVLETFSFLDDHYNSNFIGVDVSGRTSDIVDASYRHHRNILCSLVKSDIRSLVKSHFGTLVWALGPSPFFKHHSTVFHHYLIMMRIHSDHSH